MDEQYVPIFSLYEDDPERRDAIEGFVVHLAERIDLLQDTERAGDTGQLRALAELLSEDAERLGFPALAQLAGEIGRCCAEDKADAAHDALEEATDIARRIRLGHRGAL